MKLFGFSVAMCMLISVTSCRSSVPSAIPLFPDHNLELALSSVLDVPNGHVSASVLKEVTELDLSAREIRNLTGMEKLTSLEKLNISHNAITDIWPLSTLYSLTELDISFNLVADIMGVKDLPKLRWLNMSNNPVGHESTSVYKCELEGKGVVVSW